MSTFRRAIRWFFTLAGFAVGVATAVSAYMARMMIAPMRQSLWTTPLRNGLPFEDVEFPAQDGLRMSGWFVPAAQQSAPCKKTIVLVHGWQWNRLGYEANDRFANVTGNRNVDLLKLVKVLHSDGYNVLTFDMRNHGESAAAHPVTFGQSEAKDVLGALTYLQSREDVDASNIGMIGFSIGANAILFALPQTDLIRAAVAVQPTTPSVFARRINGDLFGIFGPVVGRLSGLIYQLFGGPRLNGITPAFAASGAGEVPVLYIQGTGDEWGSAEDVSVIADKTPGSQQLLFVNSQHRDGAYHYIIEHPAITSRFFQQHLKGVQ